VEILMKKCIAWIVLVSSFVSTAASAGEPDAAVEKCAAKLGQLSIVEPPSGWGYLQQYGLGSPVPVLRMMVQQSGCFDAVEQGPAADFALTPTVQIGTTSADGVGGFLSGKLSALGTLADGLKFKKANTGLQLTDGRSGRPLASAEGKATKTDLSLAGLGGGNASGMGSYTSTPEGKMIAASLLDDFNKIVRQIREIKPVVSVRSDDSLAAAALPLLPAAPVAVGQMLRPKIANVKIYKDPSRDAVVVGTLDRNDDLVASGAVRNGFAFVDGANFSGWVQRTLVSP
jgi:hypothetical protein